MLRILAHITHRLLRALDRPARNPLEGEATTAPADTTSGRRRGPAGVALVLALMTIAILSAAVVEYAYSSRVNLTMSVNARDKLKSYFLARSGVNISRLLLNFQYALQNESDSAEQNAVQAAGGSCNPGMISTAMRRSNFQMYQYVDLLMRPFNNGKLETPVGGIDLGRSGVQGFGEFDGNFDVDIEPEEGKLNINEFARTKVRQGDLTDFCALIADSDYTQIFRQDDENDQVLDQYRVLRHIIDYIDINDTVLELTDQCTLEEGRGTGDEGADYADSDLNIEPRNAKLTHVQELYQVYGVTDPFMRAFEDQMTVYPVGKPNANNATTPVFYSILCRNVLLSNNASTGAEDGEQAATLCQTSNQIAMQVMYFALALDGVRSFFKDPMSVLMAYVGSAQSRLLPSAKKGQPVAFLRSSQVHSYLEDFRRNPQLMAEFITYSPTYRRLAMAAPQMRLNPRNPGFPKWQIRFDRTGILRSVTTKTPSIYRITATGTYGTTKTTIETVVDFNKTIRRLPNEEQFTENESDSQRVKELRKALSKRRDTMPKGRVYLWRENISTQREDEEESAGQGGGFGSQGGFGQQGGFSGGTGGSDQDDGFTGGSDQDDGFTGGSGGFSGGSNEGGFSGGSSGGGFSGGSGGGSMNF